MTGSPRLPRDTRYDLVLAAIPAPLVAGGLSVTLSPLSVGLALGASSLPAVGLVGYALFVERPVEDA